MPEAIWYSRLSEEERNKFMVDFTPQGS